MDTLFGLMIDVMVTIVCWFVIMGLIAFIIHKIKKQKNFKKTLLIILVVSIVFGLIAGINRYINHNKRYSTKTSEIDNFTDINILDKFASEDKVRFREIIQSVIRSEENFNKDMHKEFWQLLHKIGKLSDKEKQLIHDVVVSVSLSYPKYFYEDALWAVRNGRPIKSIEREKYEKYLVKNNLMTEWRVKENDMLMEKIANGETLKSDKDASGVLDEDLIKNTLKGLEEQNKRVSALFTEGYFDK